MPLFNNQNPHKHVQHVTESGQHRWIRTSLLLNKTSGNLSEIAVMLRI